MPLASIIKRVQVSTVIAETQDAKTFVLQPLDDWQPVYRAGQFMTFVFAAIGGEKRRSYSISSSPENGEPLAITVKKVINGEFSRRLVDELRVGDILFTTGINGFFTLPPKVDDFRDYFFFMAGSGITPGFALIKTLLATSSARIVLIYSNRSEKDSIFLPALKALAEKYAGRMVLHLLYSTQRNLRHSRLSNSLLARLLAEYLEAPKEKSLFYVCGPLTYMQMVAITLITEGVPRANIRTESFDSTPRKQFAPPSFEPARIMIRLAGEKYEVQVKYPSTILAAARAQHIEMPYSCNTGRCGSCVARCTGPAVWMAYNEVLTEQELSKGLVLTCTAYPVNGDTSLSFDLGG